MGYSDWHRGYLSLEVPVYTVSCTGDVTGSLALEVQAYSSISTLAIDQHVNNYQWICNTGI
jgi:hypothetical protein